jgi:hypothetical protein
MTSKGWIALVLVWTVGVAVMLLGSKLVADALGLEWQGPARLVPIFLVVAIVSTVVSRRWGRAHKA